MYNDFALRTESGYRPQGVVGEEVRHKVNSASTPIAAVIVTMHAPVPEQAPLHAVNEPVVADSVTVTTVPDV